ncbi:sugar transferase [Leadbetterella sp. DM7]|uniref:sugar transferase n=1 Tax=Leadbetterella sp. DM7 TaxID=3235085 RepID=UPI00349E8E6E
MKRIFDIVMSFIGLLLLSPVFLFLAVWIKLGSKGPVFYRQTRVGKNNKDFQIYKFRSMYIDSDKGGLITIGGRDPRVTRSGYYIRKYKLDEFPQLINVIKGEMSIVGPRPEVRKYVNLYTKEQLRVIEVRPGITDIASIKYRNENELLEKAENPEKYYIEVVMQDKLKYNLEYIGQQSFFFDIKLILNTLKLIVFR